MSWTDALRSVVLGDGRRLIGATYRRVPFFVEDSAISTGRRTQVIEFPLRDDPYVEDLGRKARTISIQGYVIGDDYVVQRDALLSALEDTGGPGDLVHPYYGSMTAICSSVSVREHKLDGRMAVFSIELIETPQQPPSVVEDQDVSGLVSSQSDALLSAVSDELVSSYDVSGQPSFALQSLSSFAASAARRIATSLSGLSSLSTAAAGAQELARLSAVTDSIVSSVATIIRAPSSIVGTYRDAIDTLSSAVTDAPRDLMLALMDAYSIADEDLAPAVTATRRRERDNYAALSAAIRRVVMVQAARLLPSIAYTSVEDAVADRDAIVDQLNEQASIAEDTAYPYIVALRSILQSSIPGDSVLARIIDRDERVSTNSIALSYRLYGSLDGEQDIIDRNSIDHPGRISGDIKVLSDA